MPFPVASETSSVPGKALGVPEMIPPAPLALLFGRSFCRWSRWLAACCAACYAALAACHPVNDNGFLSVSLLQLLLLFSDSFSPTHF